MIFDKTTPSFMSPITRLKLVRELAGLKQALILDGPMGAIKRLKLISRANVIRLELTGGLQVEDSGVAEDVPIIGPVRLDTAHLYEHHEKRTTGQRQKANNAAIELLARVSAGDVARHDLTAADLQVLGGYSGNGGALIGADGKKGSAYEYYTPVPIAQGIWSVLAEMGFSGGKILDPASGTGVFGATAPATAAVDAIELDATSGGINALLNDSFGYRTIVSPFEAIAAITPDDIYDAVVTNVPFGTVADRGGNQINDPKYQKETLEAYFILRSLDKLKPSGLAAFIVPPRCTSGKGAGERKLRERSSMRAEFLGAYRMPNKVFGAAAADTITDVIFFRKYSADTALKIQELAEQDPGVLFNARVMWSQYLDGAYFATSEGVPHVLGTFKAKNPELFHDVDRVENPASVSDIAKLLRKLPESRVDWTLLDTVATMPILYQDGDTMTHAGQTLEMQSGEWMPIQSTPASRDMIERLYSCRDPYSAFVAGIGYVEVAELVGFLRQTSQELDIPGWLVSSDTSMNVLAESQRVNAWLPVLVGAAVVQVLDERGRNSGARFIDDFVLLSQAMKTCSVRARKLKGVDGYARRVLSEVLNHYRGKSGYSALWRGDVEASVAILVTGDAGFEGLMYEAQSHFIPIEKARAVYGPEFNPMMSDDWCVSANGLEVARANDFYVGNYAEFLAVADRSIRAVPDGPVKQKLMRQRVLAESRVDVIDPANISFNLFSPFVTIQEKADFLRRFVDPRAVVVFNEKTGEQEIEFDIPGSKPTAREKLLRRMAIYLKTSTVSLGGADFSISDEVAIKELRTMVSKANEQFNGWAKSSVSVQGGLKGRLSDPSRLRFRQTEDEEPIVIPGLHPDFKPHGYQFSFVRKMGRDFSGINGFGTGLGKTFTALAAVQYVHSIGVKKKTLFIVPQSVLSNWRKEVSRAYVTTDDCLFIGLREGQGDDFKIMSSEYDIDLNRILENRHSKIFMSMEAFERIPLKDDTIKDFESFMRHSDASFAESEDRKKDERAKGKAQTILAILSGKTGAAPYLEDLGVDSIVIDEAHAYKNSAATVDFTGAKFLSVSEPSKRGLDAQAKCWYVRGRSERADGVLSLTATPLTNSPLEVYSMMSLAVGHARVNDMMGGISGADSFMNAVCTVIDDDDEGIDGTESSKRVFVGLENAFLLRNMLHQVATIKDATDVGNQIHVPAAPMRAASVQLPGETVATLQVYKDAYRYAMDLVNERGEIRGDEAAFIHVCAKFDEDEILVGHPFNLINKMTLLIADPDLDKRLTRYLVTDTIKTDALVLQWNAKMPAEERDRPGPNAGPEDAISTKVKRNSAGESVRKLYVIPVRAWRDERSVCIDSMDWKLQERFEAMADKLGLELSVTVPPKLAALLENFQEEAANPRGIDADGNRVKRAKQIIFCDLLGMHNKLKRLLVTRAGIPDNRIAVITGQRNNKPDEILSVQDGFNGTGDEGKFDIIIANQKAEVGINLQKGTQAIHHLTIGWTPDSLTQRDGRGVRQGNKTEQVTIYHYDADGTFDSAKRTLVNNKASWIDSLMDRHGGNNIEISGGMSREQMEALIDVIGDEHGVARLQASMAAKEAETRAVTNRDKQRVNLDTILKQNQFIAQNNEAKDWIALKLGEFMVVMGQQAVLRKRLANPKVAENAAARYTARLSEVDVRLTGLERQINEATTIFHGRYDYSTKTSVKNGNESISPTELITIFLSSAPRGENRSTDLVDGLRSGVLGYSGVVFEVNEESELANEWASEISMSESLRDSSAKSYEIQATNLGALPPGAANAFVQGEGVMLGENPIFDGCLVVGKKDHEMVVVSGGEALGIWGGNVFSTFQFWTIADGKIVYPNSLDYDAVLILMANYEDDFERLGIVQNGFSSQIPEVGQHRQTDVMVKYLPESFGLPAPYFPFAVVPESVVDGSFLAEIVSAQAEVIVRWDISEKRRATFVVKSSESVFPLVRSGVELLVEYVQASGRRVTAYEFSNWSSEAKSLAEVQLVAVVTIDVIKSAIISGDDMDKASILASVAAVIEAAVPWMDFEGDGLASLPLSVRRFVMDSIFVAENGGAAPVVPVLVEPELIAESGDPDDLIAITGDTKPWKEEIKSCARLYGGYAKWNRHAGEWSIKRGAFDLLLKQYPKAAAVLMAA
jgi:hypothetical protein